VTRWLIPVVLLVAAACGRHQSTPARATPGAAIVERIVDGDTIVVRVGGGRERIRLIGVDTPESVQPGTPVECFAKEAAAFTARLVPPDTEVRLERDVEARDRFGRLLAYVYRVRDNLFVNLELVRAGFAQVATFPPNVAHTEGFVAAAREAREGNRGLWASCGTDEEALGNQYVRGP
jgi:micrococcal nuclease